MKNQNTIKVLLIEDNPGDVRLIKELLSEVREEVFELEWVNLMSLGVERLAQNEFDAVLLDLDLPDMQGKSTFRSIYAQNSHAPIVVLTGLDDDLLALWAVREGAQDYLIKGQVDSHLLARVLRHAIERKHAEIELLESKKHLQAIFESEPECVKLISAAGEIMEMNPAGLKMLEADDSSQVIGKSIYSFIAPEYHQLFSEMLEVVFQGESRMIESEAIGLHGTRRCLESHGVPLRDAKDQIIALLTITRDITEHKNTITALQRSEDYFRSLTENALDMIAILQNNGTFQYISPAVERVMGYEPGSLVGKNALDLIHPDDIKAARKVILNALKKTGSIFSGEFLFQHQNGSWRVIEIIGNNLLENPAVSGIVINARDTTERHRRERQLETIVSISKALRTASSRAEMIPIIIDEVFSTLKAEGAVLAMRDPISGDSVFELVSGNHKNIAPGSRMRPGEGIVGKVIETGQVYRNNDLLNTPPRSDSPIMEGIEAATCVPLVVERKPMGALGICRNGPILDEDIRLLTTIADISANAIHRSTLHEQTEQRLKRLTASAAIDTAITGSVNLNLILKILIDQVITQLHADAASVLLLQKNLNMLEYIVSRGFRTRIIERSRIQLGEGYAGEAALQHRLISVPDLNDENSTYAHSLNMTGEGFVSYHGMPMIAKGQVVGVLEVFHRDTFQPDHEWSNFLEALAAQAAIAVDNTRMFNNLKQSNIELTLAYDNTIEGWSRALDLRDKETEGHTRRVMDMTIQLARIIGVNDAEIVHIRRGSLLHDMGKMGIPDSILLKPGGLSTEEWKIMRQHPVYAYQMLSPIAFLRPSLDIPYCHHEKWDGTGYPRGLKGEEIPIAARIFAVVDVWDALTSDRPYRDAWPKEKTLKYIREQSGKHFDPQVVEAFLEFLNINA